MDPIDYADIVIEGNFLNLSIPGVVKGIELKIESNENQLSFNKGLNMDTSSTYKNKTHHILIYGLNGQYLDEGEHELLAFENSFTLLDVIVANSNNESVAVNVIQNVIPNSISLKQNYPNPFNPVTTIEFSLVSNGLVSLSLYDLTGRKVRDILKDNLDKGHHSLKLNATGLTSGMYLYSINVKDQNDGHIFSSTKKLVLMK